MLYMTITGCGEEGGRNTIHLFFRKSIKNSFRKMSLPIRYVKRNDTVVATFFKVMQNNSNNNNNNALSLPLLCFMVTSYRKLQNLSCLLRQEYIRCQFHQLFISKFFIHNLYPQLFSTCFLVFWQKSCMLNVGEIREHWTEEVSADKWVPVFPVLNCPLVFLK